MGGVAVSITIPDVWTVTDDGWVTSPSGARRRLAGSRDSALRVAAAMLTPLLNSVGFKIEMARDQYSWTGFCALLFEATKEDGAIALCAALEAQRWGIEWADVIGATTRGDA